MADFELLLAGAPGDEVVQPVNPDAEWLRQAIAWREADLADLRERLMIAEANAELVRCAGCDRDVRRDAWIVSAHVCDDCAMAGLRPSRAPDVHHGAPRPEPPVKGPPPLCVWDSE
jgi:hypothetical protein